MAVTFETVAKGLAEATGPYQADVKMTAQQLVTTTSHMVNYLSGKDEDQPVEWVLPLLVERYAKQDTAVEILHRGRRMEFVTLVMQDLDGIDAATAKALSRHQGMTNAVNEYRIRKANEGKSPKQGSDAKRLSKAFQGGADPF